MNTRQAAAQIAARAGIPADEHRGQLRIAKRFATEHERTLIHVSGIGWHHWDGTRWEYDKGDVHTWQKMHETISRAITEGKDNKDEELVKDAHRCESAAGQKGALEQAHHLDGIAIPADKLDAGPALFNTPDGTLNLNTGKTLPHNPDDYITKISGAGTGSFTGSEFENFVTRILPDEEVRSFVQRLCGYAMHGDISENVLPIFHGTGANGKTTLIETINAAFGDYAIVATDDLLLPNKGAHPVDRMPLKGARLATLSELPEGGKLNVPAVKRLTGGDTITARWMHQNPVSFSPTHTIVVASNHRPVVPGDDDALWRRLTLVPFEVVIPPAERDPQLPQRLKADHLGAVMAWAQQGWLDYRNKGLNPPRTVEATTQEYRTDSDTVGEFLADRTRSNPNATVRANELWTAWLHWCEGQGHATGDQAAFSRSIIGRRIKRGRRRSGNVYEGLMLMEP